jgi:DNA-binding transcriptional MerR regulator
MVYRYVMPDPARYSITELADLAGVTPRTVRYYLAQGLIPSPGATGPGVKYGDDVLDRLRLIRRLQREHLPLAEIRTRLAGLDGDSIAELAAEAPVAGFARATPVEPADSALDYVRRLLAPVRMPTPTPSHSLLKRVEASERPAPNLPLPAPLAASMPPPPHQPAPVDATAPPLERSQWDRIYLAPDIELHVRRPLARSQSRKVDRLVTIARELLEEDPS